MRDMTKGFWEKNGPIFVLAPMADVTDAAFRRVIAKYSKPYHPDAMWTEFVSCDGLCSDGRSALLKNLQSMEAERPIVAQFFGANPDNFYQCALLISELGFDGIYINMGCPDRSVEKQCAGAGMIKDPKLAKEIIQAAREGGNGLPVSVKTRIGYNKVEIDTWIRSLLEEKLPALTLHLRTRKEMSDVPAHWELMPQIVALRNEISPET